MSTKPRLMSFQKIGEDEEGYLSIWNEYSKHYFPTKRVFWNYGTPDNIVRGKHAHYETEMILVALHGEILVKTTDQTDEQRTFKLNNRNEGLYIPKLCWHTMKYSEDAVQLVLCSTSYDEKDYIRSWDTFTNIQVIE